MARQQKTTLRKRPSTAAGVAIADAILDAAEHILQESGIDAFTTNRLAERAGVSIGSLYQYYPNKESVLAEVVRRMERRSLELFRKQLEAARDEDLEIIVGRVVDVLLDESLGSLKLRSELRRVVPSDWTLATSQEVDTQIQSLLVEELARREDVRDGDVALMAKIAAGAVELVVESVVLDGSPLLKSPTFRSELIRLVVCYLRG